LHVSISSGNIKVGSIPQFNTLPGDEPLAQKSGVQLTDVRGTCQGCCSDCVHSCYAVRSAKLHHNAVIPSWAKNTLILRNNPERVKEDINAFLKKKPVPYFRFHTSGEIENENVLKLYCDICNDNSQTRFYIYTKKFDLIVDYFLRKGNSLPANFVINLSEWHGNIEEYVSSLNEGEQEKAREFLFSLNVFGFDDKTEKSKYASSLVHCPAINNKGHETGVTCQQCKRCMRPGHKTSVYMH
jgi:hypothetical protein